MANSNEAQARIKINRLLEEAGWRFEDSKAGKANIQLEAGVKYADLGDDFEHQKSGSIDFLLLDKDKRPLVVVEAKRESINPLSAKEQARNYARNNGARFIILSNGNLHYLWDTKYGNPETLSRFPTQESFSQSEKYEPNPEELAQTDVDENYVVATQMQTYATDPEFRDETTRDKFLKSRNLAQLRPYQVQAVRALQEAVGNRKKSFLFEMATGTGKTLVAAAIIKLFLKSSNARRVLFLVDRLELEDQAQRAFDKYLGKDYPSVIYKENRNSWANASIVVSTIQTFLSGDRYRKEFSPNDFEFVISDEAHRSIGGNSRAVFDYFTGYKLGLTATPKNYLRGLDPENAPTRREYERRVLIDTYKTFDCEPGQPTFSYDLKQGADGGYLIKPTVADARTDITAQLLSDKGYAVYATTESGERVFDRRDYERTVFNRETNVAMCNTLLNHGLYDPVVRELGGELFGKTIVFAVSQDHAARITQILNELALERWPGRYGQSNFAMQVSSQVATAQQMAINFANNQLSSQVSSPAGYDSSKTRVCVTVGMMTTGYDCPDILNVALMRPIFSPTDFVQIKGRGTRKWTFEYNDYQNEPVAIEKTEFKLLDFFANCEYFEKEFNYDEQLKLPVGTRDKLKGFDPGNGDVQDVSDTTVEAQVDLNRPDELASFTETEGGVIMLVDIEGFGRAVDEDVVGNEKLNDLWQSGDREGAAEFVRKNVFDKPKYRLNLDKVRRLFKVDRRITVNEFLEVAFGDKQTFEMKDDLLESEWAKFTDIHPVDQDNFWPVKNFFKAYIVDDEVRDIVKSEQPARFHNCSSFDFDDYLKLNSYRTVVPDYIRDYAYHLTNLNL